MRGGQTGGHPQNVCVRQLSCLHRASYPSQRQGLVCSVTLRPEPARSGIRVRRIPEEYPPDRMLPQAAKSRPREDGFDGSQRKGQSG